MRFDLGLFDPNISQPLTKLGIEVVATTASAALNLLAAEQSLVLLRNSNASTRAGGGNAAHGSGAAHAPILPLAVGKRMAVIGPIADNQAPLMGTHYRGYACPDDTFSCVPSIYEALAALNNASGGETIFSQGTGIEDGADGIAAAMAAAAAADYVVHAVYCIPSWVLCRDGLVL